MSVYNFWMSRISSRTSVQRLEDISRQLDEELDRVATKRAEFEAWTADQRVKFESARQRRLKGGELNLTEFNFLLNALEHLDSQPPETIDSILETLELLASS
jgi:hypothetical protein